MKRKLKELLYWSIILFFLLFGSLYYINYEFEGDPGFITSAKATVYKSPSYDSKVVSTLEFGDAVTIVKGGQSRSDSFVKVRIDELDKKSKLGFIPSNAISSYEFPNTDSSSREYLLLCDKDITLDEFIPKFKKVLEERKVIGIYFMKKSLDDSNLSTLENFCTAQKIPWGVIRDLSEDSISSAENQFNLEQNIPSNELFQDYSILPYIFDVSGHYNLSLIEDISVPCVLFSSDRNLKPSNYSMWLNYEVTLDETRNKEESIFASTVEKDDSFSYAVLTDKWTHEIQYAYETAREEAAQ